MALPTCTITGDVASIFGTAPAEAAIKFRLRSWDRANGVLALPSEYQFEVKGGSFTATLFRSAAGEIGTVYDVQAIVRSAPGYPLVTCDLGSITLAGESANFADLLTASSGAPVTPTEKQQAVAAAAQAAAYAAAAAASAAMVKPTASQTDTTAGRLLKVGDFGIGRVAPRIGNAAVLDNSIAPGIYFYSAPSSDSNPSTGGPDGVVYGHLIHMRRATGGGEAQIFIAEGVSGFTSAQSSGTIFMRARGTGDWFPW